MKCLVCGTMEGPFESVEFVEYEAETFENFKGDLEDLDTHPAEVCTACYDDMNRSDEQDPESMH